MIWLALRQFRTQLAVGLAALAAIAVSLVILGLQIRDAYNLQMAQCDDVGCADGLTGFANEYTNLLLVLDGLLILVPGLLGMFWGAPLVAREIEAGTHRLAWNQSVTRRRWLAVKLLVVGVACTAAVGLISVLLTWAAGPVDQVAGDRFTAVVFGARNVVPAAYAAFAVLLGTIAGMLFRRTLPAMAATLLLFVAVQVAVPNLLRPHLMPPVTVDQQMTAQAIRENTRGLGSLWNTATVKGLTIPDVPDAWVTSTTELLTADGRPLDIDVFNACIAPDSGVDAAECLGDRDLHVEAEYHPGERYWTFQWLESTIFLGLATALAGYGLWRITRQSG